MSFSVLRILTYILGIVGTSLLAPLAVALLRGEGSMVPAFLVPMLVAWAAAAAFGLMARGREREFSARGAFGIVGCIWVAICLFGAVPLYWSGAFPSAMDAVFESVSGFTTTGASVLSDVESLPASLNLWRCQTHWLGGMGVVALAVALIPLLGIGGFRLIKAETTGPDKGKVTAQIAGTAKALWFIYLGLTLAEMFLLRLAGLGWVDALAHAFSTIGTGGFSTRNASVGGFGNPAAEWVVILFMLVASVNFALYYRLLTGRLAEVGCDSELRALGAIVLAAVALVAGVQLAATPRGAASGAFRASVFQVLSILSTTGFGTSDYTMWRPAAQLAVLALFFVGGSSGSTAGGMKIVRWTILAKQLRNEVARLLHPRGVFTLRLNGVAGRESFVPAVAAFVFVYLASVLATAFAGAFAGLDPYTALTAALSMVGNIGPAFGALGPTANYGALPAALKAWYCLAMLAGRLEIYTVVILALSARDAVAPTRR